MTRIFCLLRSPFGVQRFNRCIYYGIILMVLLCMTAFAKELKIIGMDAPDFALQDAEDKDYKLKEMKDNVVILIMGNRQTRKETDKWAEAIQKDYSKDEKLKIFMIADMRGVPWFIPKGFIKGWLKKDKPPVILLLDWDGKTHIAYKTQEKKPNVFIISKVGKIVYRMDANYDDETYKETRSKIKETLAEKQVMDSK